MSKKNSERFGTTRPIHAPVAGSHNSYNPLSSVLYPHGNNPPPIQQSVMYPGQFLIKTEDSWVEAEKKDKEEAQNEQNEDKRFAMQQKQVDQKVKELVKNMETFNVPTLIKGTAELLSTIFKTDNPFGHLMNVLFRPNKK